MPVPRLDSLTGLRFGAALAVFGAHTAFLYGPAIHDQLVHGRTGVSFFFVLSGFVLTWSQRPAQRSLDFYRCRMARIYPACALVTLVVGVIALLDGERITRSLTMSLLLVQSWSPEIDVYYGVNGVTWSLACEAFFYALFPFLVLWARTLPRGWRRPAMVALVGVVVSVALALRDGTDVGGTGYWAIYILPLTRLPEFLLGILLALEVREGRWPHVNVGAALTLTAGAWLACGLVPDSFSYVAVTLVPFVVLIGAAATSDLRGAPSLFRHDGMVLLGAWSFAFYLVHQEIIRRYADHLLGAREGAPATLGTLTVLSHSALLLAVCVGAAMALFHVVERPLERRLRPPPTIRVVGTSPAPVELRPST